jgi:hypothetical protein
LATGATAPTITVGLEYSLFLNKDGKVIGASAVTVTDNTIKGVFVKYTEYLSNVVGGTNTFEYTFFNIANGEEVKYFTKSGSLSMTAGKLYTVNLTSDNKINTDAVAPVTEIVLDKADTSLNEVDGNKVKVDDTGVKTYLVSDKTVIVDVYAFNNTTPKKASDLKLATASNLKATHNVTYKLNANGLYIDYIFVNSNNVTATTADAVSGVFVSAYNVMTDATTTKYYAVVNVKGTEQTVELDGTLSGYVKGELISLTDSNSDAKYNVASAANNSARVDADTLTIGTNDAAGSFTIGGTKYLTDSNTAIYVVVVDNLPTDIDTVADVESINVGQFADIADLKDAPTGTQKISVIGGDSIGGYVTAKTVVVYVAN